MHEYLRRITIALDQETFEMGPTSVVIVSHDDFCAIHLDGICKCDPDIRIKTNGKVFHIGKDGKPMVIN